MFFTGYFQLREMELRMKVKCHMKSFWCETKFQQIRLE